MAELPSEIDVLVIGSGPIGAAFAREIIEGSTLSVLMVDAGPQVTDRPGANVRTISDPSARALAQQRSQGLSDLRSPLARPGTHLVDPTAQAPSDPTDPGMPAAALSTNVGGMGAHWTCGCPRPNDSEQITTIPTAELTEAFTRAEELLAVSTHAYPPSAQGEKILRALTEAYADILVPPSVVRLLPLAARVNPTGQPTWAGSDVVLGPLLTMLTGENHAGRFTLVPSTLCRRLLYRAGRVTGAELVDQRTGDVHTVRTRTVVVAADALRTPQLLWTSGIRPPALGRYLNDQPQVVSGVLVDAPPSDKDSPGARLDPTIGVFQVPFNDPDHPWHGQVMHMSTSPIQLSQASGAAPEREFIGLGWFCAKDIQPTDRVEFDDDSTDEYGMPGMKIHYRLTDLDRDRIHGAMADQKIAADALGGFVPGHGPRLLPAGSSLHYQGTTRIGAVDDGTSVCDTDSRVWGIENLYLGGNGMIPTATACNPTLTAVALATRAARALIKADAK